MKDSDLSQTLSFQELLNASRADSDNAARAAVSHPGQPSMFSRVMSLTKRHRKDIPREVSSKRPVPFGRNRCLTIREQGKVGAVQPFDPRFQDHCGPLREEHVGRNFEFVKDIRRAELASAKILLEKSPHDESLRSNIRAMEAEEARRRAEERRTEIRRQLIAEEKEKVKMGKKPFFFKDSAIREREVEAKFRELKSSGGVKKFIEKRRRRHAQKDRKLLPTRSVRR